MDHIWMKRRVNAKVVLINVWLVQESMTAKYVKMDSWRESIQKRKTTPKDMAYAISHASKDVNDAISPTIKSACNASLAIPSHHHHHHHHHHPSVTSIYPVTPLKAVHSAPWTTRYWTKPAFHPKRQTQTVYNAS